jgi:hypothetical protein
MEIKGIQSAAGKVWRGSVLFEDVYLDPRWIWRHDGSGDDSSKWIEMLLGAAFKANADAGRGRPDNNPKS